MGRQFCFALAVCVGVLGLEARGASGARILPIEGLTPTGVSSDGTVVGGHGWGDGMGPGFWTGGVLTRLGNLTPESEYTYGVGISGDGRVIVGNDYPDGMAVIATRAGGVRAIGGGGALAASHDGSVVVGHSPDLGGFRWTEAGGMVALGNLGDGTKIDSAYGISADGSVIVGDAGQRAFRMTPAGAVLLGDLDPGLSGARAVTPDGAVVVGSATRNGVAESFRWTAGEGMRGLGHLAGYVGGASDYSMALDVTADGGTVVGQELIPAKGFVAYVWDETHGIRPLSDALAADYGMDMSGWTLDRATGISADGGVIVGHGSFGGEDVGFVVEVPEPGVGVMVAGAWFLAGRRGRRAMGGSCWKNPLPASPGVPGEEMRGR